MITMHQLDRMIVIADEPGSTIGTDLATATGCMIEMTEEEEDEEEGIHTVRRTGRKKDV